jgi:tyrosine-protein phosphatase SIW14
MYCKTLFKPQAFFVFLLIVITFSCSTLDPGYSKTDVERPGTWATPIVKNGLPNFFKVSDSLYRGAQPTKDGFLELKKMGIKTIINLREYHTDENLINGMGFNYFQIPTSTSKPLRSNYQKFLDIVKNRITVQKWDTEEAIRELQEGGYGYHPIFKEIIKFVRSFNDKP